MKSFILSIQGVPKLYYDLEFQDRRYRARKLGTNTEPVQEVVPDLPPPAPPPPPEPEIVIEEPQTKTTKTKAKSKKKA